MKRPLPAPVQGTTLTDKDGKPTSHNYRWIESVGSAVIDTQDSLEALDTSTTNSINTLNTSITNLTSAINDVKFKNGTSKNFSGSSAQYYDFTVSGDPKFIVVMFSEPTASTLTLSSTSETVGVQLGSAGGIDTTADYEMDYFQWNSVSGGSFSAPNFVKSYFAITGTNTLRYFWRSILTLTKFSDSVWYAQCSHYVNATSGGLNPNFLGNGNGQKTLGASYVGPITTVRILTSGTSVIQNGTVNILYQ